MVTDSKTILHASVSLEAARLELSRLKFGSRNERCADILDGKRCCGISN